MPVAELKTLHGLSSPWLKNVGSREFEGPDGPREGFFLIEPNPELGLDDQLRSLQEAYASALAARALAPETAIFRRFFVSDVINQMPLLRQMEIGKADGPVAVSIIGQPPAGGARVAMLGYHLASRAPVARHRLSVDHLLIEHHGLRHLWSTQLCAGVSGQLADSSEQTRHVFGDLHDGLDRAGANLRDHCVRTWLYLKDIDVFYQGMVEARRAMFETEGLTADTHYVASTGIEGACGHRLDVVSMDAYSALDVSQNQISYLKSLNRLCPTNRYGVTFERGTRVAYADRAHLFISGTAAIDGDGRVMHLGDVTRQLARAIENVEALLTNGDASLDDLMYLLVYLRDVSDEAGVREWLSRRFPSLPVLVLHAAVCRPEWLVEVEGVAIAANRDASLPQF
jgi:enamine deaminase RidA (YjgF/YER057c/UK114 family)